MVKKENKSLIISLVVFAGIVAVIFILNRWIGREMAGITRSIPPGKHVPEVTVPREETAKPRPVVIDPANDPLAPVVHRASPKSTAKTTSQRPPSPQKVYEPSLDADVLVQ